MSRGLRRLWALLARIRAAWRKWLGRGGGGDDRRSGSGDDADEPSNIYPLW